MQYEQIEAIVRKGERDERRRRRQFGLGKLLLWTAVAALLLGVLRMLGLGPVGLACVAAWVGGITGVRWAFGGPVAFVVASVAGGIAAVGLVLVTAPISRLGIPGLVMVAMAMGMGGLFGYVSYVLVEVVSCIIGLPDGLLRAEDYDRQGPP